MSQVYVQMTEAEYLAYLSLKEELEELRNKVKELKIKTAHLIEDYSTVDLFDYTIKKIMHENKDNSSKGPTFCDSYENEFVNIETEFLAYDNDCEYKTKIKIENMIDM